MDWFGQGRKTALSGQTAGQGAKYFQRECHAEHGIDIDQKEFARGYAIGLKEFCSPQFTYKFAADGGRYQGTCPEENEPKVIQHYQSGRLIFLEKQITELQSQVSKLTSDSSELKDKVSDLESENSRLESDLRACGSR